MSQLALQPPGRMVTDAQGQERQVGPVNLSGAAAISTRSNGNNGGAETRPSVWLHLPRRTGQVVFQQVAGVRAGRTKPLTRQPPEPTGRQDASPADPPCRHRPRPALGAATSAVACGSRPHRLETPEVPPWECGCLQMSPFPAGLLPTAPEGGLVGVDEQLSEMRDRTEPGGRRVAGLLRGSRAKGVRSVPASSSAVQHSSHR